MTQVSVRVFRDKRSHHQDKLLDHQDSHHQLQAVQSQDHLDLPAMQVAALKVDLISHPLPPVQLLAQPGAVLLNPTHVYLQLPVGHVVAREARPVLLPRRQSSKHGRDARITTQ